MGEYDKVRKELGKDIYLWGLGSQGFDKRTSSVMISSHGWAKLLGKTYFVVPHNTTIAFLGPQGFSLADPGFENVATTENPTPAPAGTAKGTESIKAYEKFETGSLCPDYYLSKYQGRHNKAKNETYDDIKDFLSDAKEWDPKYAFARFPMDIVTIRNRGRNLSNIVSMGVTLSEVLTMLACYNYRYDQIVCSFCRGYWGPLTMRTHQSADNSSDPKIHRQAPDPAHFNKKT
jgi:hypothetical protein